MRRRMRTTREEDRMRTRMRRRMRAAHGVSRYRSYRYATSRSINLLLLYDKR